MTMEAKFDHKAVEKKIYEMWEKSGAFAPAQTKDNRQKTKDLKPFTIVLPPPNASGKMHIGNVLMIAIEDLLIRRARMQGRATLWVPGTDHAGFETQITYERELKKQGKSRFDFDRQALYDNIDKFVQSNRGEIEDQIRTMGASVDWSRNTFTLDTHVVETVYKTFEKMYAEGLVYRDNYMVNYCPKCGTTFADLEVLHKEQVGKLYYVKFKLKSKELGVSSKSRKEEYIVVATTRPETIMLDTHIAVNPKDKKKASYVGRRAINPLTGKEMEIIADSMVDPKFGTGFVKLTPAHDKNDYEAGKRHKLPMIVGIGMDGRMTSQAGEWEGKTVFTARKEVVERLTKENKIEKIDDKYEQSVAVCYKGGHAIEPMVLPNWFVRVEKLKRPALEAMLKGEVKIYPKWREKTYTTWMEEMHDWPISRQVVWGMRIPVWYEVKNKELGISNKSNAIIQVTFLNKKGESVSGMVGELLKKYKLEEIRKGLQTLIAPAGAEPTVQAESPGEDYLPETDTFDTWFSSGHWPLVVLKYPDGEDYKRFYPISVMETGWEIIRFWVSRMIMFGIYLTDKPPFSDVYLHGMVRALDGKKMSKSLGNVINPEEYMEKYGVDALRMGLISGTANGKDFSFPRDKVIAYRNFANKLWNITRFFLMRFEEYGYKKYQDLPSMDDKLQKTLSGEDKKIVEGMKRTIMETDGLLEKYRFAQAAETIYHYVWDEFASDYLEKAKKRMDDGEHETPLSVIRYVLIMSLKLMHPFMPFVTEELWGKIPRMTDDMLIVIKWPAL